MLTQKEALPVAAVLMAAVILAFIVAGDSQTAEVEAAAPRKSGFVTSYENDGTELKIFCHAGIPIAVVPPKVVPEIGGVGGGSVAFYSKVDTDACW